MSGLRKLIVAMSSLAPTLVWGDKSSVKLENSVDDLVVQAEIPKSGKFMGYGFDALWMMNGPHLVRIAPEDNSAIEIELGKEYLGPNRGIATGEGAVWVPDVGGDTIYKVDPATNAAIKIVSAKMASGEGTIGVGEAGVWVVTEEKGDRTLVRFDPASGAEEASISLPSSAVAVIVAYGSVWVTGDTKSELYRIDPKSNLIVATIPMSSQPRFLAAGEGSVWVFNQGDGIVQRVDPGTNEVTAAIDTGRPGGGGNIVVGGGYVWLSMLHGTPVVQIDANTNKLIRNFRGYGIDAGWGDAIQFGADSVWVSGSSVHRIEVPN